MLRNDVKSKEKRKKFMDEPWESTGKKQKFGQCQCFLNNSSTKAIMSGLDAGLSPILDEDESVSDETPVILLNKLQLGREEIIGHYSFMIDYSIQKNDIAMIAVDLDYLKSQNLLLRYLTAVDYKIASWAFEQESRIVLEKLFKTPEKIQFLIACHNNYQITKEFVQRTIQLSFEQFQQQAESKRYIFNLLLRTKTHLLEPVIRSVIEEYTDNTEVDSKTVNALQVMVSEIIKELTEKLTDKIHIEIPVYRGPRFN